MTISSVDLDDIASYDYKLPRELIAQHPVEHRIDARLMLVDRASNTLAHYYVRDLPEMLRAGDALVLNNSKVIAARLIGFRTSTHGKWEGLFLRRAENDVWELLSKTRGSLTVGETISLLDRDGRESEQLVVCAKLDGGHIAVRPIVQTDLFSLLSRFGRVPLPPYIRDGHMTDQDSITYQTVYSKEPGSVAAPTAGLHFTADLLKKIQSRGVLTAPVTLHVGLGTFRPISSNRLAEHKMHFEQFQISDSVAQQLNANRAQGGRVIAVGTTSIRVLESALSPTSSQIVAAEGQTDLFIRPGFSFRAVDALLTNFHLPKSTLLVLAAAFAGHELIMRAYQAAIDERYRFYSYGDCMLII